MGPRKSPRHVQTPRIPTPTHSPLLDDSIALAEQRGSQIKAVGGGWRRGGSDDAQVMMKGRRFLGNSLVLLAKRRPGGGVDGASGLQSPGSKRFSSPLFTVDKYVWFFLFVCFLDIKPNLIQFEEK